MTSSHRRDQRRTRRVFLDSRGSGPWPCSFCGDPVLKLGRTKRDGNIHHLDDDYTNDDPENLDVGHHSCHTSHHVRGRTASLSTRQKMSRIQKGRKVSAETGARISASKAGKSINYPKTRRKAIR